MDATPVPEFATLVRQNQALVFSIAYHYLHDRAAAEEVAQEVLLQLHQNLGQIQSAEHAVCWLRKTAVHRSIDYARRARLRPQVSLEDAPEPATPAGEGDPLLSERLRKLVASLPEKPRMVMILRYQEDLEPAEIAGVLNMPVRTVKSHLARSLAMLREKVARTLGAPVGEAQ
ncbi:MAG TPA: sigma-70 family RNA polymerase sigma factor [Bryobacteraceae bacterium]|nr:sigma-70 family RNA polymerase sigma factor [Bryobacteraceae bacterium]